MPPVLSPCLSSPSNCQMSVVKLYNKLVRHLQGAGPWSHSQSSCGGKISLNTYQIEISNYYSGRDMLSKNSISILLSCNTKNLWLGCLYDRYCLLNGVGLYIQLLECGPEVTGHSIKVLCTEVQVLVCLLKVLAAILAWTFKSVNQERILCMQYGTQRSSHG